MPQKRVKRKKAKPKKPVRCRRPRIRGGGFIGDAYKKAKKVAPYVLGIGAGLGAGYLLMNAPGAIDHAVNTRRQNWYSGHTGIKYKYIK